jgi:flagellin-like protein
MNLIKFRSNDRAVSPVIAIILMVAITVVLASVLYVWVVQIADPDDDFVKFPTVDVTLRDVPGGDGDSLAIKHKAGNPLDWSKYKIIITNQSDETDTAVMNSLSGEITAGEISLFGKVTNTTSGMVAVSGFGNIDYQKTKSYQVEIYDIGANKLVWQKNNVICY